MVKKMKVNNKDNDTTSFELIVSAGPDPIGIDVILSADNSGVRSLLDLGHVSNTVLASSLINRLALSKICHAGIRLQNLKPDLIVKLALNESAFKPAFVVLSNTAGLTRKEVDAAKQMSDTVIAEIFSAKDAKYIEDTGVDGIIIRGNEAGGFCGAESNSILLEKIKRLTGLSVWVQGGIGPESACAYYLGGADGVVITDSLLLAKESIHRLQPKDVISLKGAMRTVAIGPSEGPMIRLSASYGKLVKKIECLCAGIESQDIDESEKQRQWVKSCLKIIDEYRESPGCFIGEESYWAKDFASESSTVSRIISSITKKINEDKESLKGSYPFEAQNSFARDLNIKFPVLQGPMANVSDNPDFLKSVAESGALPFAALSVTSGEVLRDLFKKTHIKFDQVKSGQAKSGRKPWGVGLLGFTPKKLWDEQLQLIKEFSPSFAIVAGGRPSHYKILSDLGITPFLHIPSPSMIKGYFKDGVRHFIFEGRGSGGHVGPINSFPLWQAMISELTSLSRKEGADLNKTYVVLAGGIGNKETAAMAAAFAPPLLKLGVKVGFIMGTAYLFTREVVESGSVVSHFQHTIVNCNETVVLENGGGHAIRCVPTPAANGFAASKAAMLASGQDLNEIRQVLDNNNIGRLRIATRGLSGPYSTYEEMEKCVEVSEDQQFDNGVFMTGEVAGLMEQVNSIDELHKSVCEDAQQVIAKRLSLSKPELIKICSSDTGKYRQQDIAIIGLSSIVPGAKNLDTLWHNILSELNCITDIPKDRWDIETNFDPDPQARDKIYSSRGGFLGDITFNSMEFGIPPKAVSSIEPAQLLVLEAVKQAIADAGYDSRPFDRDRTSVIFGSSGGGGDLALAYSVRAGIREYLRRAKDIPEEIRVKVAESLCRVLPEWTADTFPGILGNVIAGRVSNQFDLKGLNFSVDAACASSLTACQVACQELSYGITKMAIVGGVDTSQHPFGYTCFSKTQALSKSGASAPFDKDSDGIILSEGVGVIILKRVSDAVIEGDRIYAVIKGVGGASDGKGRCLTVPASRGQMMAINRAYEIAGYSPSTIQLIEAHGTGTVVGDNTEIKSIQKVFEKTGNSENSLAVGSIKSAIGHTKAAAGVLGVIKTALALYHKVLPATINIKEINPEIISGNSSIYINTKTRPWIYSGEKNPRRAGVNSFGFGGTNFHVAMEEFSSFPSEPVNIPKSIWPDELFLLSGNNSNEIIKKTGRLLDSIKQSKGKPLSRLALEHFGKEKDGGEYTGRVRIAITCSSAAQLEKQLVSAKGMITEGDSSPLLPGLLINTDTEKNQKKLAVLFPGQGSQAPEMLSDLAIIFPVVRETFEAANSVLSGKLEKSLSNYIFPPPPINTLKKEANMRALTNTVIAQPALATVEIALYKLLLLFGIKADLAAGHSFGELTALCSAGVFDEKTLIRLSFIRGYLMSSSSPKVKTGMTAIKADGETVLKLIKDIANLNIANFNAPNQTVVSGSGASLIYLEERLRDNNIWFRRLQVSNAFHSPFMKEASKKWSAALEKERFFPPEIPVYSNATASFYDPSPAKIRQTLSEHFTQGVRFVDEINSMSISGAFTFLEAGPGTVLTGLVDSILEKIPHEAIAVQPKGTGFSAFCNALAKLWVRGYNVDLSHSFQMRKLDDAPLEIKPSATIFLVNGARAKSSIAAPDDTDTTSSDWDFLKESGRPQISTIPFSDQNGREESFKHTEGLEIEGLESGSMEIDSTRLKFLGHIQDSMDLFLKSQEKLQKERKEMMEQMWEMNQSIVQTVMGGPVYSRERKYLKNIENKKPQNTISFQQDIEEQKFENNFKEPVKAAEKKKPESKTKAMNVESILMDVISERTAYPVEMLELDQHLEADLGIDSIKRVEIIGSLKEKDPAFGEITDEKYYEEIAQLKTIGEIVNWIKIKFKTGIDEKPEITSEENKLPDVKSILMDVISERTAYPVEMLEPDQHLEADLGIDSIKRVEIIGSLKEKDPAFGEITDEKYYEEIAQLKTIGEIVNWIKIKFKTDADEKPEITSEENKLPDVKSILMDVISERTAYPVEMLESDQHLEADLGIDSIKRVEIIGSLKEKDPLFAEITDEKYYEEIAQLKTIGEIVNWIEVKFRTGIDEKPKIISESVKETGAHMQDDMEKVAIDRYILKLSDDPVDVSALSLPKGFILILNNSHKLGETLYNVSKQMGIASAIVSHGKESGAKEEGIYTADFSSEKSIQNCYKNIKDEYGKIGGILNLLGFGIKNYKKGIDSVKESFLWAKSVGADFNGKPSNDFFWISVTGLGGDFGLSEVTDFEPVQNGIHGITKSLFYEWPNTSVKTIDLNPEDEMEDLVKTMITELGDRNNGIKEICWLRGERKTIQLEMENIDITSDKLSHILDEKSVILLTGGAKGITADVALHLAKKYSPTLILTSRSSLPERTDAEIKKVFDLALMGKKDPRGLKTKCIKEMKNNGEVVSPAYVNGKFQQIMQEYQMRTNIAAMEDLGAKVFYFSADCTDEESFSGLIRKIYKKWGKIDGVIHGAGVIRDSLIIDKTADSFMQVLNTKVKGAEILSRELNPESLSFLVFFSSVSGRFGNQGQADYAAANEILNKMAVKLDRLWPARVVAINWGPWEGEGMVSHAVREQFEKKGIYLIPRDIGVGMLEKEILYNGKVSAEVIALGVKKELAMTSNAMAASNDISDKNKFVYTFDLNLEKHTFLNDHMIVGEPVLPAAMAMEMMAQAAVMAVPGYKFSGYKDLHLFKGITLEDGTSVPIQITAKKQEVSGSNSAEVETVISMAGKSGYHINYKATILLGDHEESADLTFERLNGIKPFKISVEQAYNTRLFHDGVFCNIKSIEGLELDNEKDRGIKGIIKPSHPEEMIKGGKPKKWFIDPVVFDCAYQMALLWTQEYCDMMALPSDIEKYISYRPYDGDEIFCEVHVNKLSIPKMLMDFIFFDEKGSFFAKALNVSVILSKDLNRRVLASITENEKVSVNRRVCA